MSTASWFDPQTGQSMLRIVQMAGSVKDVVERILGLRSDRGHPAAGFTRDDGSSLLVATDGHRAFLVWADTLGDIFHSVGSSGGPPLIFDYFGSWSEATSDCLVPLNDAVQSVAQFLRTGKPDIAKVIYQPE